MSAAAAATTAASLGPMPHSKDIGYIPADIVGLFCGDRPHEDESESLLRPHSSHHGMTNSFGQCPCRGPLDTWSPEDDCGKLSRFPVDEASEVRRLPRPRRTRGPFSFLSLFLSFERARGIELPPLGISVLTERPAYLVNEEERLDLAD